jgi:hypothetical protein
MTAKKFTWDAAKKLESLVFKQSKLAAKMELIQKEIEIQNQRLNDRASSAARNRDIVKRVLFGEPIKQVAADLGISYPAVRNKVLEWCLASNPKIYHMGIRPDETNNYASPPLKYLIGSRGAFGFNERV